MASALVAVRFIGWLSLLYLYRTIQSDLVESRFPILRRVEIGERPICPRPSFFVPLPRHHHAAGTLSSGLGNSPFQHAGARGRMLFDLRPDPRPLTHAGIFRRSKTRSPQQIMDQIKKDYGQHTVCMGGLHGLADAAPTRILLFQRAGAGRFREGIKMM